MFPFFHVIRKSSDLTSDNLFYSEYLVNSRVNNGIIMCTVSAITWREFDNFKMLIGKYGENMQCCQNSCHQMHASIESSMSKETHGCMLYACDKKWKLKMSDGK